MLCLTQANGYQVVAEDDAAILAALRESIQLALEAEGPAGELQALARLGTRHRSEAVRVIGSAQDQMAADPEGPQACPAVRVAGQRGPTRLGSRQPHPGARRGSTRPAI